MVTMGLGKSIRTNDQHEANMAFFSALYTTLACVTLPLCGISYKVAFLFSQHFQS